LGPGIALFLFLSGFPRGTLLWSYASALECPGVLWEVSGSALGALEYPGCALGVLWECSGVLWECSPSRSSRGAPKGPSSLPSSLPTAHSQSTSSVLQSARAFHSSPEHSQSIPRAISEHTRSALIAPSEHSHSILRATQSLSTPLH
jgi:hypothetical protein